MHNIKLTKEDFKLFFESFPNTSKEDFDYIYQVYDFAFDAVVELLEAQNLEQNTLIDSFELISYIIGEYLYSTQILSKEAVDKFRQSESVVNSMASVSADKYLSLSLYNHKENRYTNRFLPPISSMNLYVNLMLNIVSRYPRNDPKNTLIIDLLTKSLSIARSILMLLYEGYETDAFAIWRTLHECECTLIILERYGDVAINAYLKHMRYGIAYKGGFSANKDEEDAIFAQIKEEMAKYELKSKDMKKYIEYGWMNVIVDSQNVVNFKLNFRDGLESLAGLHQYSQIYMTSSEILHSTPLLIYSDKEQFYYLTLLNLYESFFRIEKVFTTLFFSRVGDSDKEKYIEMRNLYFAQLVNIHRREKINYQNLKKRK